jgi:hypothetical protein
MTRPHQAKLVCCLLIVAACAAVAADPAPFDTTKLAGARLMAARAVQRSAAACAAPSVSRRPAVVTGRRARGPPRRGVGGRCTHAAPGPRRLPGSPHGWPLRPASPVLETSALAAPRERRRPAPEQPAAGAAGGGAFCLTLGGPRHRGRRKPKRGRRCDRARGAHRRQGCAGCAARACVPPRAPTRLTSVSESAREPARCCFVCLG